LRCGRADRVFMPSGLAKIFSDNSGVPSRHRPARRDRLYQRAIRSEELVPIIAVGVSSKSRKATTASRNLLPRG
jgi:hypothetical protein